MVFNRLLCSAKSARSHGVQRAYQGLLAASLCLLSGALLAPAAPVLAASMTVTATGNGAQDQANLDQALNQAQAGDTIQLQGDFYPSMHSGDPNNNIYVHDIHGNAGTGNWITIKNVDGQAARLHLNGASTATSGISFTSDCTFIRLQGLELIGNPNANPNSRNSFHGIGLGGPNFQVVNCSIHDFGGTGVGANNLTLIRNCTIYNCASQENDGGSGISAGFPSGNSSDDLSHFATDNGESGNGGSNQTNYYGIIVVNNTCYNNVMQVDEYQYNADGTSTYIGRVDGNGIIVDTTTQNNYPHGVLVANNVCYGNGSAGVAVFKSSNVDVFNNTCYHNSVSHLETGSPNQGAAQIGIGYGHNNNGYDNICDASATGKDFNGFVVSSETGTDYDNNLSYGDGNATISYTANSNDRDGQNPLFVDPANGNFQLQSGSPAIGAGETWSQSYTGVTYDHDDNPRSSTNDMGAYQSGTIQAGKLYRLRNAWSGLYLDTPSQTSDSTVDTETLNTDWWSEQWYIEQVSGNLYRLRSYWSNLYLTIDGTDNNNAAHINGLNTSWLSEEWYLENVSGNLYRLRNAWASRYLTVNGTDNGEGALIYDLNSTWASEQWYLEDPPVMPAALKAVAGATGTKKITVSWTSPAGATGYKVYRSTSSAGTYSLIASLTGGTATTYVNTGLTAGTTYYYKVSGIETTGSLTSEGSKAGPVSAKAL